MLANANYYCIGFVKILIVKISDFPSSEVMILRKQVDTESED